MSTGLRTLLLIVGLAATVALLFLVVFPWFDETFVNDPVLGGPVSEQSERRHGPVHREAALVGAHAG